MMNRDFYVSTKGNDSNLGTKENPFLTIQRAVRAVRDIEQTGKNGRTVYIEAGEYRVSSLVFTEEDSGTAECPVTYRAYGGEVVLNGGVTLSPNDFRPVKDYPDIAERLTDAAKENVVVIDLTRAPYSLTQQDWGKIYAIGSYHTACNYDGDYVGPLYCELFVNDQRQTVARYPDHDFLYTEEVISTGLGMESNGAPTTVPNWRQIRNPEPDVYAVNPALAERIAGWKNLDEVWMFGYWKYDWADASSPIGSFDRESGRLSPAFVSLYGTKTGAPYYFFNILEELTAPGEWYLDRSNGLLCLWKPDHFEQSKIDLSLSLNPIIQAKASFITLDGITIKGTRGDAVVMMGDHNTVENCSIKNVAGNALVMTGSNNLAYRNEITHTGKGGIILTGGDAETLTAGNNKADNNYIHDWSEIYLTYQPAVRLDGVGNICSHNEMVNSSHEAITYTGNNHIIEYNLIHDVCRLSDDAGAIYAGRSWVNYGNIVRYNYVYHIGSGAHKPHGIYLDDALSGQQIYGNLLVDIPGSGMLIGGGRDNLISGNIIANPGQEAIFFDDRAREGARNEGWFTLSYIGSGGMWEALYKSPWQSTLWQEAFPQYRNCTDDRAAYDTAAYIPNPASTVTNNLICGGKMRLGYIVDSVYEFGTIADNALYSADEAKNIFADPDNGDYTVKDLDRVRKQSPDFENIPLADIGRSN